jgi:hypothetical protein
MASVTRGLDRETKERFRDEVVVGPFRDRTEGPTGSEGIGAP